MAGPRDFSLNISRFVNLSRERADEIVRKLALDICSRVIMRSPVDTGHFRANWQVGLNTRPTAQLAATDKGGAATIAKASAELSAARAGGIIWIANNLPYAVRLEYGYSKQAPAGMVRITSREFQTLMRNAVNAAKQKRAG